MALPDRVLIDTSAHYALLSDSDSYHSQARDTFERIVDRDQELWTTSYVLVECMALVHRRLGFSVLSQFITYVESSVSVFWIERTTHAQALIQLIDSQGSGLSFVDWTIALASDAMRAPVFTFDRGFANRGYSVIPS